MLYYIYCWSYIMFAAMNNVVEGFTAVLTAVKLSKLQTIRVDCLQLNVGLDEDGKCIAPSEDGSDPGSRCQLSRVQTNVSLAGGLTEWLLSAEDTTCSCGGNPECPRCDGTNICKDVEYVKCMVLPDERERTTVIAVFADTIRRNIKAGKYKHLLFVTKGNQMFLCTVAALERLVGETRDGKALKRGTYFAGYYLYSNTTPSQKVRVAILKEEDDFNGQLMWNVKMALGLDAHAIRLLKDTIVKGSARTICTLELEYGKKMFNITQEDVIGIGTHELIKRVAKHDIVEDCENYYVIEFDIADLKIVNPPLKQGFPGLGLSLWKYGKAGMVMNKMVTHGIRQLKAIKLLKRALAGEYDAESTVLGLKLPNQGDTSIQSPLHLSIPTVHDGKFIWRTPKDKQAWTLVWQRFYKYMMNNILRIELDGVKGVVASCSMPVDAYEHAYHLQNPNGEQKAFAIFPDQQVRTSLGKITMEDALANETKGFVMIKNPTASIRQFTTLTTIGQKSMLGFLLTGQVVFYEDDAPIIGGPGALVVSSDTMQRRNCVQDFDGDQPVLGYFDIECCPVVQVPTDWVAEFVTKDSGKKVVLETEQEKLEYYSDLMMTIVAARQAIAPMVLGSLAGYVEMIVRAFKDNVLDGFSLKGWDGIQRLLSAIAEIYAIKKEKSMADAADKKTGWLWVDMFLELYVEGKEMIPVRRKTSKHEMKMANLIRNLVRPKGDKVVETETGEYETVPSMDRFDVMKSMVKNAKAAIGIPDGIKQYFPSIYLMEQFHDVNVQMRRRQPVNPRAKQISEMGSDMQIQQAILKRALECHLASMGITKVSGVYVTLEKAAREFIIEIREGIKEVMHEFDSADDSIEKLEMVRESQAFAIDIMVEEGLCQRNNDTPWIPGEGLDPDREYLFALLVGIKDMQYVSRENNDGERTVEDGKRSSFNKCTAEGLRRCILGYFGVISTMTVGDFYGSGDQTKLSDVSGFHVPHWLGNIDLEVCVITDEDQEALEIL